VSKNALVFLTLFKTLRILLDHLSFVLKRSKRIKKGVFKFVCVHLLRNIYFDPIRCFTDAAPSMFGLGDHGHTAFGEHGQRGIDSTGSGDRIPEVEGVALAKGTGQQVENSGVKLCRGIINCSQFPLEFL